jgi:hypothetical protein
MLYKRSSITLKLIKMNTISLIFSLIVATICAMSSQTKAEHWGYDYQLLDDDVCDDGKDECDIVMAISGPSRVLARIMLMIHSKNLMMTIPYQ